MTITAHELELRVYNDSIRRDAPQLVDGLREIIGAQLVAYIGSVRETRAVREWAEGTRRPSSTVIERLRIAFRVASMIERREGREIVAAWFQGMNPDLADEAPARVIRQGDPTEVGPEIIAAARTFLAE